MLPYPWKPNSETKRTQDWLGGPNYLCQTNFRFSIAVLSFMHGPNISFIYSIDVLPKVILRGAIIENHFIRSEVLYGMNSPFELIQPYLPCLFKSWAISFVIRLKFIEIWHIIFLFLLFKKYTAEIKHGNRVLRILWLHVSTIMDTKTNSGREIE